MKDYISYPYMILEAVYSLASKTNNEYLVVYIQIHDNFLTKELLHTTGRIFYHTNYFKKKHLM